MVGLINPLRSDRVPDAFPAILQDAIIIGIVVMVATFVFDDKLLTTSAVGAAIVGFALQDTLGNAFAGLAIQSEKPFRVGAWIKVAEFEGRVAEVTWRATKLRTKSGNFVIVPNNIVAKEAITNYSEPLVPTRIEVEVGASYLSTPGEVKRAIREAVGERARGCSRRRRPRRCCTPSTPPRSPTAPGSGSTTTSSTKSFATRCGRRFSMPSIVTASRSRGRSRWATNASGPSRTKPPSCGDGKRSCRASICSPGSRRSSVTRWLARRPSGRTGMASQWCGKARRETRCSWWRPVTSTW